MFHPSRLMRTLLLISVLALAFALAACGGAPAAPAPAEEAPAPHEAEAPAAAEPAADTMYNEAPMLAERVAAGELPNVDERLPAEPLVQEVVDEIGTYGGTLRRAFLGPSDHNNYTRVVYDALVRHAPDGGEVIPHIAKGWESNDDFTEWTVFLREGMKWSDGEPFTADDIMFWYENILAQRRTVAQRPGLDEEWRWFGGHGRKGGRLRRQVDLWSAQHRLPARPGQQRWRRCSRSPIWPLRRPTT